MKHNPVNDPFYWFRFRTDQVSSVWFPCKTIVNRVYGPFLLYQMANFALRLYWADRVQSATSIHVESRDLGSVTFRILHRLLLCADVLLHQLEDKLNSSSNIAPTRTENLFIRIRRWRLHGGMWVWFGFVFSEVQPICWTRRWHPYLITYYCITWAN